MKEFGVSLSGGGYRAAAFHLGTLRALHKIGALKNIDVMSTISGGSITGAAYCLQQEGYPEFEKQMAHLLAKKNVIKYVLTSRTFLLFAVYVLFFLAIDLWLLIFTSFAWVSLIVTAILLYTIVRFQFRLFPVSKEIERAYNKFFYNKKELGHLPDKPELAIGSTNLQTGTPFTFSRRKMGDSYYSYLPVPVNFSSLKFPVARAVVASSCVPFAFTPVTIAKEFFVNPAQFSDIDPKLVDGGVYDNQGIHKLTTPGSSFECRIVVTSDAGNKLPFEEAYNNTIILLIRTVDVFMARIKDFQMIANLYRKVPDSEKEIAYLSLGWDLEGCIPGFIDNMIKGNVTKKVVEAHGLDPAWAANPAAFREQIQKFLETQTDYLKIYANRVSREQLKIARAVGTNLTPLTVDQIRYLSQHAANLTELQVRLYCPSLIQQKKVAG